MSLLTFDNACTLVKSQGGCQDIECGACLCVSLCAVGESEEKKKCDTLMNECMCV